MTGPIQPGTVYAGAEEHIERLDAMTAADHLHEAQRLEAHAAMADPTTYPIDAAELRQAALVHLGFAQVKGMFVATGIVTNRVHYPRRPAGDPGHRSVIGTADRL